MPAGTSNRFLGKIRFQWRIYHQTFFLFAIFVCSSHSLPLTLLWFTSWPTWHDNFIWGKKKAWWLLSNWKDICNVELESTRICCNDVESCRRIFLHPLVCLCATKGLSGKIEDLRVPPFVVPCLLARVLWNWKLWGMIKQSRKRQKNLIKHMKEKKNGG